MASPRKPEQARSGSAYGPQAYLDFSAGIGNGSQDLRNGINHEAARRQAQPTAPGGGNGEKAPSALSRDGAFDHLYSQAIDDGEKGGSHLIIDETASIDELIAQISNFGRPKA